MSADTVVLRFDATEGPTVKIGDRVRKGQPLADGGAQGAATAAPASGTVTRIDLDAPAHEFVLVFRPEE